MAILVEAEMHGIAGPTTVADGASARFRTDNRSGMVSVPLPGIYREPALRGTLFKSYTAATGVTIPIFSNTTQQFVISNPSTSTVNALLHKCYVGYISGTHVAGHLCYAYNTITGTAVTGTAATIQRAKIGSAAATSGAQCQVFTAATVTAFTYLQPMGVNTVVLTAASAATPWQMVDNIDAGIIVAPGQAIAVCANVAAIMVAAIGITWEELAV